MQPSWKIAGLGAVIGAALALILIFAAAALGYLPVSGPRIHDYLMAHPELAAEMSERFQEQQQDAQDHAQADAMRRMGLKPFFNPRIAFITGPADAKKTLVEFYDYDCPYCRASLPAVKKYYEAHKNDTRFAFIEFPLPDLHGPGATLAARVSLAARQQPDKFLAFHFALMSEKDALDGPTIVADAHKAGIDLDRLQADMRDPQIDAAIAASHRLAHDAAIDATPTFIINGKMHPGALEGDELEALAKG
ncbi:MAG TPA: DsbA family protein [Rhizomicrobium sp.]